MNLESQIVIFSCNQRTVKNCPANFRRKKFMAKCKRNRNRAKRNFTFKTPAANRNYKDTVFRMLFSDRKNLLSLYNAVNQRKYLHQILSSFTMVRRQLLTVQSFGFPQHLNICQVNQSSN